MLRIRFIVVDRTRSPFLKQGEDFYLKRLRRYARTEWVEVKPVPIKKGRSDEEILAKEGGSIAKRLLPQDYVTALDRRGKGHDSLALADRIDRLTLVRDRQTYIIGGPLGLSKDMLKRADEVLSLSPLTFTHEMTRLILLEQLYRACTIIMGEKYHK